MTAETKLKGVPFTGKEAFWEELLKPWRQIVVDVGSRGFVSTTIEDDNLLILIDPEIEVNKPNWGENYKDQNGGLIIMKRRVRDLEVILPELVDRVQMIAPDPNEVLEMLDQAFPILRVGGSAVIIFDKNSNKFEKVKDAIRSVRESYSDHVVTRIDPLVVDLSDVLEGELNSGIIQCPEECRVLQIIKV